LSLTTLQGEPADLLRYRGRLLVLNLWAPWCSPCVQEMPSLDRLSQALDPARFAVVGLSSAADRYLLEEFLRRVPVGFPLYVDPGGEQIEATLGVYAFPETLLVAPDGVLLARIPGSRPWDSPELQAEIERLYRQWEGGGG
jgi:thiol-disulfide isomerase/thioredoxin